MVSMNKLTNERRAQVIKQICEGSSIRTTVRITGVAKNTIVKLLAEIGVACMEYQDKTIRNLPCKRIQCDEIWSFCYAKDKNVPDEKRGQFGFGDVWTWTAIDPESKLIVSWAVGIGMQARLSNSCRIWLAGFPIAFNSLLMVIEFI